MLTHLLIKNYALIERLEMSPDQHLNIITGETGAGKSIMLGAIGLLLGNRADTKTLLNEDEKCIIEGTFDISGFHIEAIFEQEELDFEPTCLIRREISPTGKSRAFVNDTPVTLDTLRNLTSALMDIHSQHDSVMIASNEYQLQIVDTYARNYEILKSYTEQYQLYRKAKQQYENLLAEASANKKEFDYQQFLLSELQKAKLQAQQQQELEKDLNILENAEEVKMRLQTALAALQNSEQAALHGLQEATNSLGVISKFSVEYHQIKERVLSCLVELKDVAEELTYLEEGIEFDEERTRKTKERLDLIYNLEKKHQVDSVEALLTIQADLSQKVGRVLNFKDLLEDAQNELTATETKLKAIAEKLSASRKTVFADIEKGIENVVVDLGIPNAHLKINHQNTEPNSTGTDTISLLFSANKGIAPQALKSVASGGEFSRLMLAIKYILADKRSLPTIIFDEIDTGVSGEIAIKVGNMMREMSKNRQIIAITHLPQIAGKGTRHFYVYKNHQAIRTQSTMRQLSDEERIAEIAQMIGGQNPSDSAIRSAIELLETN